MEKKKISEIFNDHNEVYFRKLENKYLKILSKKKESKIISLGGGTPCFTNNIKILDSTPNSIKIYLKASVNCLIKRLKDGKSKRPLISNIKSNKDLKEFISKHLFDRAIYYENADVKLSVDNLKINEIVRLISNTLT